MKKISLSSFDLALKTTDIFTLIIFYTYGRAHTWELKSPAEHQRTVAIKAAISLVLNENEWRHAKTSPPASLFPRCSLLASAHYRGPFDRHVHNTLLTLHTHTRSHQQQSGVHTHTHTHMEQMLRSLLSKPQPLKFMTKTGNLTHANLKSSTGISVISLIGMSCETQI